MKSSSLTSSTTQNAVNNRSTRKLRRSQEERSRDTRAKIIHATCKKLLEHGYAKLTVEVIATAAGVTSGARVHHFTTKLDLMVAVWMHLRELIDKAASEAVTSAPVDKPPLDTFLDFGAQVLVGPHAIAFHELMGGMRIDHTVGAHIRRLSNDYRKKFHSLWVELFVSHGYDRDEAATLLDALLACFRGLAVDPHIAHKRERIKRVIDFWKSNSPYLRRNSGS